jgi:hypothetical protein
MQLLQSKRNHEGIESGKGTMGKLINDEALYSI